MQHQRLRHKTLSAYYDQLQTLGAYLTSGEDLDRLVCEGDAPEYQDLLKNTICAFPDGTLSRPSVNPNDIYGTQQDLIDRILLELRRCSRTRREGKNVLLAGDRGNVAELPINPSRPGVENRHASSPIAALRSLPWRILRSRVGDSMFRHVLIQASLFAPVGNNCFIQLSGVPVFDLYDRALSKPSAVKKRKRRKESDRDETSTSVPPARQTAFSKVHSSAADTKLARQKLFYAQPARRPDDKLFYGLSPQHILNRLSPESGKSLSNASCLTLLQAIFPASSCSDTTMPRSLQQSGSMSRLSGMVGAMREVLSRHGTVDYAQLVHRCAERRSSLQEGLQPVSHSLVMRFAATVIRTVFPKSFLGSDPNVATLIRHSQALIAAKQYEPFTMHAIMQEFRVNDVTWLCCGDKGQRTTQHEMAKRRSLVEHLLRWICDGFLIPLLRNTFYITETAETRYQTVYYLHDDWSEATKPHFSLLEDDLLEKLDKNERYFALQGPLGVSAVRLIPKPNGFRPIVNLGRRIKPALPGVSIYGSNKAMTANQILRNVHQILTFEKERKRSELGASLFGTNEIFAPLRDLKQELQKRNGKIPRLFFVKLDIKAAFDTIRQDKMLGVVSALLDKNYDYCLMLYCLLLPPASLASQNSARRLFKTRATVNDKDGSSASFVNQAKEIAKPLRNAVIIGLVRRRQVTRQACMDLLRMHIKQNVWQVGNSYFRQKTGIPQGSKISSLLCSFFYAALEREHLSWASKPGSCLLRYIDDFLYITDDYQYARRFVTQMSAGFPEYGAFISPAKTMLSFEYATGSQVAPVCDANLARKSYFPYCGFLIDTQTLDLSMDYPRTLTTDIKQSFALRSARHHVSSFVSWLSRQLENRNHVAYLDTQHNDISTVHLNIFLNFALTSMKIPHYFSNKEAVSDTLASQIFEAMCAAAEYTCIAGRARVLHASREDKEREHYCVRRRDFIFLAISAFIKVLQPKASRFRPVLHLLHSSLNKQSPGLAIVHSRTISNGWTAVKDAKY